MTDQADRDATEMLNPAGRGKPSRAELVGLIADALRKRDRRIAYWQNLYWKLADRYDALDSGGNHD